MNCWDNACSEVLFGSLKVERLHGMRIDTRYRAWIEVIALSSNKLSERAGRWLKLLSGAVMPGLGSIMILRPGWLL